MGLQEKERGGWELKVSLRKNGLIKMKPFRLLPFLNPSGYSWPLPLILIMIFGRWMSRVPFLNGHLDEDEPCVYKKCQDKTVMFLVLYVDDIRLIGNDVGTLPTVRIWLSNQFDSKWC